MMMEQEINGGTKMKDYILYASVRHYARESEEKTIENIQTTGAVARLG